MGRYEMLSVTARVWLRSLQCQGRPWQGSAREVGSWQSARKPNGSVRPAGRACPGCYSSANKSMCYGDQEEGEPERVVASI